MRYEKTSSGQAPSGMEAIETSVSNLYSPGDKTLYRGFDLDALAANSPYEDIAYLLLHGDLPDAAELTGFMSRLARGRELPPGLLDLYRMIPPEARALDVLRTSISFLGSAGSPLEDGTPGAIIEQAERLVAQLPTAIAARFRIARGLEPIGPQRYFGHAQNLLYMISGYVPDEEAVRALDALFVLCAEGEPDGSHVVAHLAASTQAGLHAAVTAAVSIMNGASQSADAGHIMRMLKSRQHSAADNPVESGMASRTPGFGQHASPQAVRRAEAMKALSLRLAEHTGDHAWHRACEDLESACRNASGLSALPSLYAAAVFLVIDVPVEICSSIIAAVRTAGWAAHFIEQSAGSLASLPSFRYCGSAARTYLPLSLRKRGIPDCCIAG